MRILCNIYSSGTSVEELEEEVRGAHVHNVNLGLEWLQLVLSRAASSGAIPL